MNTYTVTMQLPDTAQFMHFIDNIGPLLPQLVVSVVRPEGVEQRAEEIHAVHPPARAPRAPRKRISRVNQTILDALEAGPRPVKDLKATLEVAGYAAGSLSTALAVLQRTEAIERVGDGVYALKGAQAAE